MASGDRERFGGGIEVMETEGAGMSAVPADLACTAAELDEAVLERDPVGSGCPAIRFA
jgi:hypothetical protein